MLGSESAKSIMEAQMKLADEGLSPKNNDWRVTTEDALKIMVVGAHLGGSNFLGHLINSHPGTFYR